MDLFSPDLLSYTAKAHLPGNDAAHKGLGPSASISNQEKRSTDMPTGHSAEGNPSNESPTSQVC